MKIYTLAIYNMHFDKLIANGGIYMNNNLRFIVWYSGKKTRKI